MSRGRIIRQGPFAGRRERLATAEEAAQAPDAMLEYGAELIKETRIEDLAIRALAVGLNVREQEVVEARWLEGLTQEKAGERLNLTRQAVWRLEQSARRKLAAVIRAGEAAAA